MINKTIRFCGPLPTWLSVAGMLLLLSACGAESTGLREEPTSPEAVPQPAGASSVMVSPGEAIDPEPGSTGAAEPTGQSMVPSVQLGTGMFVRTGEPPAREEISDAEGEVTLNFENTDLREVLKVILGDTLQVNYLIDPKVKGSVTLRTSRPMRREDVLPVLESVMQLNGAALVRKEGLWEVRPTANAQRSGLVPELEAADLAAVGYGIQVVPLEYVAAADIQKVLEPFVPEGTSVRADDKRNLLIVAGPQRDLAGVEATIKMFDADWLKGMSFGIFPLDYSEPVTLAEELETILEESSGGTAKGIIRIIPIERLNSLLVIARTPKYMPDIRRFIGQLDRAEDAPGRTLYVYHVQNGRAERIAGLLQSLFGTEGGTRPSGASAGRSAPALGGANGDAPGARPAQTRLGLSGVGGAQGPITIVADEDNNALLIKAGPTDYRAVEAAIRELDIRPRQVLIEATVAEVQLNDQLQYGVQWFLDERLSRWDKYSARTGFQLQDPLARVVTGGYSFALTKGLDSVRLLFDLLAEETSVRFLSSPQVLVVDNQSANFRVGDSIPLITRASQSTISPDAPIVSETQYRDTGVLLQVTPRINAGGLVTLEISQEVSRPGPLAEGAQNPPIGQRTIQSTVVVQSGQTVLIGGLIREQKDLSNTGVPGLRDVPVVDFFFSRKNNSTNRIELLITITPSVIASQTDALEATEEIRRRLKDVRDYERDALRRGS